MSVLSLIPEEKKCYQGIASSKRESTESVYSSGSRVYLLHKRKGMGSTAMLASNHSLGSSKGDRSVTQRVLSARMHRVRQLQNQLADAHFHLSEVSNENKVLRAMQKKHEFALQKYEDSNAELPKVLNSHSEEVRAQQARYKQLRQQYREATGKLKEREMELQQLRDEHRHLLELSKDRNLLEREKLQTLVTELTEKVTKQSETITNLQRRLTLEAKNFRHQLQQEVMRHKDTRNDLDLAINNADKLSSIIEMKERVINNGNGKRQSNSKLIPNISAPTNRPINRTVRAVKTESRKREEVYKREDIINGSSSSSDNDQLSKLCENSRYVSSALSQDDNLTSDVEPRTRSAHTNRSASSKSITPTHARRNSKHTEEVTLELANTVKDGMAEMSIFREEIDFDSSRDDIEKKITMMKSDLLHRIKSEEVPSRTPSAGKKLTETCIEEHGDGISEVSRIHSRRSSASVAFKAPVDEIIFSDMKRFQHENDLGEPWAPPEAIAAEKKLKSGKCLDTYCKGIMQDIEKSSSVIDQHMKEYSSSRFNSDKLVEQLQTLDKMNEIVKGENLAKIPAQALEELNNNFRALASQDVKPVPRKRSLSGNKSVPQRSANAFGDASMSNQDLLNDLLGTK